jgi:transcriptional repressor NrdR
VRFASVYRSFKDLNEFREEIDRLTNESDVSAEKIATEKSVTELL